MNRTRHAHWSARAASSLFALLVLTFNVAAGQVTKDEASTFWNEFDDATLRLMGPVLNQVYGNNAAGKAQARADMGKFSSYAGLAIRNEILMAHDKMIPQMFQDDLMNSMNMLGDNTAGAIKRLSNLQLELIKKHFKTNANQIDFAKFQNAVELFANGEIRGAPGTREMNQLYQWVVWKQYALAAIDKGVDTDAWSKILKSLEKGFEMHKQVYPGPARPDLGGPLYTSTADRFDATKQLSANDKMQLRQTVDALNTMQIVAREKSMLKPITTVAAEADPRRLDLSLASVTPFSSGGASVTLDYRLSDLNGNPISGDNVTIGVTEAGIIAGADAFVYTAELNSLGAGEYEISFLVPTVGADLNVLAVDNQSLSANDTVVAVPEPSSLILLAFGFVGVALAQRKVCVFGAIEVASGN